MAGIAEAHVLRVVRNHGLRIGGALPSRDGVGRRGGRALANGGVEVAGRRSARCCRSGTTACAAATSKKCHLVLQLADLGVKKTGDVGKRRSTLSYVGVLLIEAEALIEAGYERLAAINLVHKRRPERGVDGAERVGDLEHLLSVIGVERPGVVAERERAEDTVMMTGLPADTEG